jgi:hypothetical protein
MSGSRRLAPVMMLVACGAPPAPDFDVDAALPTPAAATCEPPFERFGPGAVRVTDLQREETCITELDRDECIIGIFDDCTEPSADLRREWQGRIRGNGVDLEAFYVGERPPPASAPVSCTGTISMSSGRIDATCTPAPGTGGAHEGLLVELVD